jgi:hypothetical protein
MNAPAAPDAALVRWTSAIPSVRCSAAAIAPWTGARGAADIPATATAHFDRAQFTTFGENVAIVARGKGGYLYVLARVPSAHAVVLHAGSEAEESSYSAVVGEAETPPPGLIVTLAAATRTREALGLGSTRAAVERVLGAGTAHHTACGTDVVRYVPAQPAMSEASLWFVYRNGRVVAFARYEAV